MRLNRIAIIAFSSTLALGCGSAGDEQDSSSPVQVQLGPRGVDCLYGADQDGDGVVDLFDAHAPIVSAPSARACRSAGGAVFGGLSDRLYKSPLSSSAQGSGTPPGYSEGGDLPPGVRTAVEGQGPQDNEWIKDIYDCDDFAHDLERVLDDEGFDGTYTEICKKLPSGKLYYHAVTDVHVEGTTYWIEPQSGARIKLDGNGDGKVDTVKGHPCDSTSEGGFGVRVWPDRAARIAELGAVD